MNRSVYYEYIDEKLHVLAHRIDTGGKLNMLSSHMHSEIFYLHFFNLLFSYKLTNLNQSLQNVEAIDLIDHTNKIIIQVSATNTKAKIEAALKKEIIGKYKEYTFKFISISKDASNLRKNDFINPHAITFSPSQDIYDTKSILSLIYSESAKRQKDIYNFIKNELGDRVDYIKLDSNLATIINVLAKENWDESNKSEIVSSFQIDRKISHNDLDYSRELIKEYCLYHSKINTKYAEFDNSGSNKSNSVLASIKREYLKVKNKGSSDDVFFSVIEAIKNKIIESANYNSIPIDELELCVDILVVDAFVRCKIMENPVGYQYASA